MSKQKILMMLIIASVATGGFFVWKKRMTNNQQLASGNQQDSITNIQKTTDNNQEIIDNNQEAVVNGQDAIANIQNTIANEQQAIDNNQNTKVNEQEATSNSQNTKNNNQNTTVKSQQVMDGKIVQSLVAWGFEKSSGRKIDTLVVHTSYNALGGDEFDKDKVIQEWKDAGVAPHYMIARDGTVYQLVADQNIAWHAGVAKTPDGRTDVNSFSLGIEIINTRDGKFTSAQYDASNRLISDLKKKYTIKYILGHSDIAPDRKTDPWGIDWKKVDR